MALAKVFLTRISTGKSVYKIDTKNRMKNNMSWPFNANLCLSDCPKCDKTPEMIDIQNAQVCCLTPSERS